MKRIYSLLTALLLVSTINAQSPDKFNYQAVIRNSDGSIKANQSVNIQIGILQGSVSNSPVYIETHAVTSTSLGLVNLIIGNGTVVSGSLSGIDWSAGPFYLKIWVDSIEMGTNQLLSVPYAKYAEISGSAIGKSGHYIGELFGGGIVFYVDPTGQHGLICSLINVSISEEWSNVSTTLIGSSAQSEVNGLSNTNAIINQTSHTTSAAKICHDYTNADYGTGINSDWYLPSIDELIKLSQTVYEVNKVIYTNGSISATILIKTSYWSSSENANNTAWTFAFFNNSLSYNFKDETHYVRAVRSF